MPPGRGAEDLLGDLLVEISCSLPDEASLCRMDWYVRLFPLAPESFSTRLQAVLLLFQRSPATLTSLVKVALLDRQTLRSSSGTGLWKERHRLLMLHIFAKYSLFMQYLHQTLLILQGHRINPMA